MMFIHSTQCAQSYTDHRLEGTIASPEASTRSAPPVGTECACLRRCFCQVPPARLLLHQGTITGRNKKHITR